VQSVAGQSDRAPEHGDRQFDQTGDSQADRADPDRAVSLPSLVVIVMPARKGKLAAGSWTPPVRCMPITVEARTAGACCRSVATLCNRAL
jgi:hypothetical protein